MFEYPYVFGLFFLYLLCEKFCKEKRGAIFFPHIDFLNESFDKLFLIRFFIVFFVLFALASPVSEKVIINKKVGHSIVLDIDSSGSMQENNKYEIVKQVASDFIKKRKNDNVGLVVFGSYAYVASPLTFDKKLLIDLLNRTYVGIAGEKTAISDSLLFSEKLLIKDSAKSKVIIMITDGIDTNSNYSYQEVIKIAKKYHIKIYTIGIGSDIDRNLLAYFAYQTGGKFFQVFSVKELKKVYEYINKLESSKIKSNQITIKKYYYQYPLFIAILLLMIYIYLRKKDAFFK